MADECYVVVDFLQYLLLLLLLLQFENVKIFAINFIRIGFILMSGLDCGFHHAFAIFENLDTSLEDTLLLGLV
jgi:hypothetical protein